MLFTRALMLSHKARSRPAGTDRRPFFNSIIWVVEKESDLPDWLIVGNPRIRHVPISRPMDLLAEHWPLHCSDLPGAARASQDVLGKAEDAFVDGTEGMLLLDMNAIALLARVEGVSLGKVSDAVRRYKVGVTEDPWLKIDRRQDPQCRVLCPPAGQGPSTTPSFTCSTSSSAPSQALAAPARRPSARRRVPGGPTGVGKTELAKTITSLLFGDESAYIRFDMSEFSAEHADQRLIGAPPGYIGYDAGGELTNAIREKPFQRGAVRRNREGPSADPRQVPAGSGRRRADVRPRRPRLFLRSVHHLHLEPGDLQDRRSWRAGSQCLGIEPYDLVKERVESEIDRHFKFVLNRPEILNRIGENIIVFDFIREEIAAEIFEQMVAGVLEDLGLQGITVTMAESAKETLGTLCLRDLSNGGRGIRNQVEAHLLNPLARSLFDVDAKPGDGFVVDGLEPGRLSLSKN